MIPSANNEKPLAAPLPLAIAGLGGFGSAHHEAVEQLENKGYYRLLATCDPRHAQLAELKEQFRLGARQVAVFEDFDEMMMRAREQGCEAATISTPIRYHASMHATCVDYNIACYLEKPPTLCPAELEAMIEKDRSAPFRTLVGFAYIVEKWRQELKQRVLTGDFGRIESASYLGAWQRGDTYYQRAPWAGKLLLNDTLLLDSCFGNAMSHHVHNLLFFCGEDAIFSWAKLNRVRAELYRANPIESADTIFSEAITETGIPMRVAMSHATPIGHRSEEILRCERALIRIVPNCNVEINWFNGRQENFPIAKFPTPLSLNLMHFARYLRGQENRPPTCLEDCRPFVQWNALNYLASGEIHPINQAKSRTATADGNTHGAWTIERIEESLEQFARSGIFPSETNISWARPGGEALPQEVALLGEKIRNLAEQSARCTVEAL